MNLVPLLIIAGVILVVAIILVVIGLRTDDEDPLEARLAEFAITGETVNLEQIELSQSFSERVLIPMARSMGAFALRFTPQNSIQQTARKLELAGNPRNLDPTVFLTLRISGIAIGVFMLFISYIAPEGSFLKGSMGFILAALFALLGFFVPELWLTSKIQRRQKDIRRALPDALDLLTICVEAGLGFEAAMSRVQAKWDTELSLVFARALREIQLGKTRREAMREMADRVGIPEITSFVAAVIQSDQLGVSLSNILRVQSEAMRVKRRQMAEEEAQKAPIKMLFPMAFLIFPSLMIILLGPAALLLMNSALGGML